MLWCTVNHCEWMEMIFTTPVLKTVITVQAPFEGQQVILVQFVSVCS